MSHYLLQTSPVRQAQTLQNVSRFEQQIATHRQAIDHIDLQLLALINQRAQEAKEIGAIKQQLPGNNRFYSPAREADLLRKISQANNGSIPDDKLLAVFREIISLCLSLEQKQKIEDDQYA